MFDESVNQKLLNQIREESMDTYGTTLKQRGELNEKISQVSESAKNHQEEIAKLSESFSTLIMTSLDIHSELLAGIANFKAILTFCYKGQLATEEVSELTGYTELKNISPEHTVLKAIIVNKPKASITFIYKIKNIPILSQMWIKISIGASIATFFISISCVIICKCKTFRKRAASKTSDKMAVPMTPTKEPVGETEVIQVEEETKAPIIEWE